jgi:membrane-bound metal-dependent hydrolase YbcI (DUF457 family)
MDPITHALVLIAASRAGLNRLSRLATPMLLVSGLAADLDLLTAPVFGQRAYLESHSTFDNSLVGAVLIAAVVALCFTIAGRKHTISPIRFFRAFSVCAAGALLHVALDFAGSCGVKLFWPFSGRWFALDLVALLDPWILIALLAGILLPALFRVITDEIGAKQKSRSASRGAIAALALIIFYTGGRDVLHIRAMKLMNSRLYRGAAPLAVGAFPESTSPFRWSGVVVTENILYSVDVPILGQPFDPDSGRAYFKPQESAALEAARATTSASLFLSFARFPRAHVEQTDAGYHIEIRDLRLDVKSPPTRAMAAIIDLNPQGRVVSEKLEMDAVWWR